MPAQRVFAAPNSRAHRRPPSPTSRSALVVLPAGGCELPVPEMPPGREWTDAERARWDELWRSPQADQWDESAAGTVAALVIFETLLMTGGAAAWHAQEARHAADALGLTPRSMTALGWKIADRE